MTDRPKIHIRWRRYGQHGGRWRAELPPGNGIDSGSIESSSLATVEVAAHEIGHRHGYAVVVHAKPEPSRAALHQGDQNDD